MKHKILFIFKYISFNVFHCPPLLPFAFSYRNTILLKKRVLPCIQKVHNPPPPLTHITHKYTELFLIADNIRKPSDTKQCAFVTCGVF